MITEMQVREILQKELPEIKKELEKLTNLNNIYKTMQCFVDITKKLAGKRNMKAVKKSFKLAERILKEGNNTVKNAVENVYVFSISTILNLGTPISKKINTLFNGSLRKEY